MDDRTMIAAMAMQGILAGLASDRDAWSGEDAGITAHLAVERADALLAELAKTAPAKAGPSPAFKAMREAIDVLLRCRGNGGCACFSHGPNDRCSAHRLAEHALAVASQEHPRA